MSICWPWKTFHAKMISVYIMCLLISIATKNWNLPLYTYNDLSEFIINIKRMQIIPYKNSCRLKKGLLIWSATSLCSWKCLLITLLSLLICPLKKPDHFCHAFRQDTDINNRKVLSILPSLIPHWKNLLIVDVCVLAECMLEVVRFLPRGDEEC